MINIIFFLQKKNRKRSLSNDNANLNHKMKQVKVVLKRNKSLDSLANVHASKRLKIVLHRDKPQNTSDNCVNDSTTLEQNNHPSNDSNFSLVPVNANLKKCKLSYNAADDNYIISNPVLENDSFETINCHKKVDNPLVLYKEVNIKHTSSKILAPSGYLNPNTANNSKSELIPVINGNDTILNGQNLLQNPQIFETSLQCQKSSSLIPAKSSSSVAYYPKHIITPIRFKGSVINHVRNKEFDIQKSHPRPKMPKHSNILQKAVSSHPIGICIPIGANRNKSKIQTNKKYNATDVDEIPVVKKITNTPKVASKTVSNKNIDTNKNNKNLSSYPNNVTGKTKGNVVRTVSQPLPIAQSLGNVSSTHLQLCNQNHKPSTPVLPKPSSNTLSTSYNSSGQKKNSNSTTIDSSSSINDGSSCIPPQKKIKKKSSIYKCDSCEFVSILLPKIFDHFAQNHPEKKIVVPIAYEQPIPKVRTHNGFRCVQCSTNHICSKSIMINHLAIHCAYVCEICLFNTNDKNVMKTHKTECLDFTVMIVFILQMIV